MELTTFLLSLAGALAWTPFLFEKCFKKTKINGKLIGLTISADFTYSTPNYFTGATERLSGIGYFPKFVFVSLVKDFNIKNVEVKVKYPGETELRGGTVFFSSTTMITSEGKTNPKKFTIPVEEHISSLMTFKKNSPAPVFIPFCVNKPINEHFESIEIAFTEYDGTTITVSFDKADIDVKNIIFEKKYWSQ